MNLQDFIRALSFRQRANLLYVDVPTIERVLSQYNNKAWPDDVQLQCGIRLRHDGWAEAYIRVVRPDTGELIEELSSLAARSYAA